MPVKFILEENSKYKSFPTFWFYINILCRKEYLLSSFLSLIYMTFWEILQCISEDNSAKVLKGGLQVVANSMFSHGWGVFFNPQNEET